jgi:hypothetical protein
MKDEGKKFELAPQVETELRRREIQLLINIAEPDPQYQPFLLTDEASIFSAVGTDESVIKNRMTFYFGENLELPLHLPLWRLVDRVRKLRPGWPEEGE